MLVKIFVSLSWSFYFDQGWRSCPGASCLIHKKLIAENTKNALLKTKELSPVQDIFIETFCVYFVALSPLTFGPGLLEHFPPFSGLLSDGVSVSGKVETDWPFTPAR